MIREKVIYVSPIRQTSYFICIYGFIYACAQIQIYMLTDTYTCFCFVLLWVNFVFGRHAYIQLNRSRLSQIRQRLSFKYVLCCRCPYCTGTSCCSTSFSGVLPRVWRNEKCSNRSANKPWISSRSIVIVYIQQNGCAIFVIVTVFWR